MWKLSIENVLIILGVASFTSIRGYYGIEVNLTEICSGSQSHSCVIFRIHSSYEDPLLVLNSNQEDLHELIIRDTGMSRFPREMLQRAPNLNTFVMDNTGLNRISSFDFGNASQLHTLILQRNRLSEISEKVFSTVPLLKELYLGRNNIHMVHRLGFFGLNQLSHLDLQHNAIHQLSPNLFSSLTNLEYLDLSANDISEIDSSTFEKNTLLSTLLLNNNEFVVFEPNSLEHLPHLSLLDISNSALEEINLQAVDTFYVQNSSLKRCQIGAVIELHASFNKLTRLNVTDKESVHELMLHGNLFESIDDFAGMFNLQRLDLSKNYISTLSNFRSPLLLSLPCLSYLNLAFNKLTNLTSENFLRLSKLTHLDLAFNHLTSLDTMVLEPLQKLEKFFISGNGLHFFDYRKFLETHPFIKEVDLFGNSRDPHITRELIDFFKERSVQLTHHYPASLREPLYTSIPPFEFHPQNTPPSVVNTSPDQVHSEKCQWGFSSPHILLIATFVLVLMIFVLQVWRLVRERDCSSISWQRSTLRLETPWQVQPLDECLSEV